MYLRVVRSWVVKGKRSRNNFAKNVHPGATERWVTGRPPKDWAPGDQVFLWESAPGARLIAFAEVTKVAARNAEGDAFFTLRYTSDLFSKPLGIEVLRGDTALRDASFLKAGAAGTVFPLSTRQASRLVELATHANPEPQIAAAINESIPVIGQPRIAVSVRQPWAELIMRGSKTIEARTKLTRVRGRVFVYAGKNRVNDEDEARVTREYGLEIDPLPRGVLVGTVEIVGCRPLTPADSKDAAFPVRADDKYFAWLLANPVRAERLRPPERHPQPMFFRPF